MSNFNQLKDHIKSKISALSLLPLNLLPSSKKRFSKCGPQISSITSLENFLGIQILRPTQNELNEKL